MAANPSKRNGAKAKEQPISSNEKSIQPVAYPSNKKTQEAHHLSTVQTDQENKRSPEESPHDRQTTKGQQDKQNSSTKPHRRLPHQPLPHRLAPRGPHALHLQKTKMVDLKHAEAHASKRGGMPSRAKMAASSSHRKDQPTDPSSSAESGKCSSSENATDEAFQQVDKPSTGSRKKTIICHDGQQNQESIFEKHARDTVVSTSLQFDGQDQSTDATRRGTDNACPIQSHVPRDTDSNPPPHQSQRQMDTIRLDLRSLDDMHKLRQGQESNLPEGVRLPPTTTGHAQGHAMLTSGIQRPKGHNVVGSRPVPQKEPVEAPNAKLQEQHVDLLLSTDMTFDHKAEFLHSNIKMNLDQLLSPLLSQNASKAVDEKDECVMVFP